MLKPRISGSSADKVCRSFGFDNWIRVEAIGFSGGIWVLWRDNLQVDIVTINPQFVLARVKHGNDDWCFISFVYGSPTHSLRRKLWEGLSQECWNINGAWISIGDYNVVLSIEDVSNTNNFASRRCAGMRNWVFKEGLVDVRFEGLKYTWMRGRSETTFTRARLDRALCNFEWLASFPHTKVTHLARIASDHAPILISTEADCEGNDERKFKFEAAWVRHSDFNNCMERTWNRDNNFMENIVKTRENL